jgi:acetylornithine deacetylase
MSIVIAQGGSLMFRLQVHGRSAHACVRGEGVSAIEKFAHLHDGLLQFEARRNQEIDHPQYDDMPIKAPINVGTITGGTWHSTVPEMVVVEGRAGLVPGETLDAFKSRFANVIEDIAQSDDWLAARPPIVEWLDGQFAPADVDHEHQFVGVVQSAVATVGAVAPQLAGVTYGADMRHFVLTGAMPCVMFGAGDVRLAHAPDESIPLNDLFTAILTTAVVMANWCGSGA